MNPSQNRSTHFGRSVVTLLTGSASALVVTYLAQPFLVRLFTPEEFGLLDVFVSIISLLIPIASFRYEDAVMLPEGDEEAINVWWLAFLLMIGTTLGYLLVSVFAGHVLFSPDFLPWAVWIAPTLFVFRSGKLMELWLTRKERFRTISQGQVVQALATTATRLGAGVQHLGVAGLIGGYLFGAACGTALWTIAALRHAGRNIIRGFRPAELRVVARRYRNFPAFAAPATLLNALVTRLPFLLLLYFFDATVVGYFGRAFVVLAVPLSLIGNSFSQFFFVEGARAMRSGALDALTRRVHRRLVAIGLFPTLVVMIAGPELIAFVFGTRWEEAGVYLQYVAPWLFLASVASPLTRLFDLLERQRTDLAASILMFLVQTSALVVAGSTGDLYTTLLAVGIGGAGTRLLHLLIMFRIAGCPSFAPWRAYLEWGLRSIPFLAVVFLAHDLPPAWMPLAITTLAGGGYAAMIFFREKGLDTRST